MAAETWSCRAQPSDRASRRVRSEARPCRGNPATHAFLPPFATDVDLSSSTTMVHVRLNERETNPNPHVNFITALPMPDAAEQEEARQLLRALAAQVRPIMKAHGFVVNSLEEVRTEDSEMTRIGYTDRITV